MPKTSNKQICYKLIRRNTLWKVVVPAVLLSGALIRVLLGMAAAYSMEFSNEYGMITRDGYILLTLLQSAFFIVPAAIFLMIGIAKYKKWDKDPFSKAVMRHVEYPATTTLEEAFAELDEDIAQNGVVFRTSKVYIGKTWVAGRSGLTKSTAFRIENVRGIFRLMIIRKRNEYGLYLMDADFNLTTFFFSLREEWEKAFDLLQFRCPNVPTGGLDDYSELASQPEEKREALMRKIENALSSKRAESANEFTFYPATGSATSQFSSTTVVDALAALQPGQCIRLHPLPAIKTDRGACNGFRCTCMRQGGIFQVEFLFQQTGIEIPVCSKECTSEEASRLARRFYEYRQVPDWTDWNTGIHYTTGQQTPVRKEGKITIDIEQLRS